MPVGLIVGEEVSKRSRREFRKPVDDVPVDVLHRLQIDEVDRRPREERCVPEVLLPLGDILEHYRAALLPVLECRRDRLHLVEGHPTVVPPVGDVGDHLLPLEPLDDGEGFGG